MPSGANRQYQMDQQQPYWNESSYSGYMAPGYNDSRDTQFDRKRRQDDESRETMRDPRSRDVRNVKEPRMSSPLDRNVSPNKPSSHGGIPSLTSSTIFNPHLPVTNSSSSSVSSSQLHSPVNAFLQPPTHWWRSISLSLHVDLKRNLFNTSLIVFIFYDVYVDCQHEARSCYRWNGRTSSSEVSRFFTSFVELLRNHRLR